MSVSLYGSGQTVIQVVTGSMAGVASTSSTSFVTTGLSATITPQSTNSKILAIVTLNDCYSPVLMTATLYRGGSNLATSGNSSFYTGFGSVGTTVTTQANISFTYLDSPATTASTTYTVYFVVNSGSTSYVNGNNQASYIQLLEISGS
jgi:hypothetical protein